MSAARKGDFQFRANVYKHVAQEYAPKNAEFTAHDVVWTMRVNPGPRRGMLGNALKTAAKVGALSRGNGRVGRYRVVSVARLVALAEELLREEPVGRWAKRRRKASGDPVSGELRKVVGLLQEILAALRSVVAGQLR